MKELTNREVENRLALAGRLLRSQMVVRRADPENPNSARDIATEAAHGLDDIHRACQELFERLVPQLLTLPPESEMFEEVLHEIGEEYRHIYYHISSSQLFDYVRMNE